MSVTTLFRGAALGLACLATLAECSNAPDRQVTAGTIGKSIFKGGAKPHAPTADQIAADVAKALSATDAPLILLTTPQRKAVTVMQRLEQNRGYDTYGTADRRSVTMRVGGHGDVDARHRTRHYIIRFKRGSCAGVRPPKRHSPTRCAHPRRRRPDADRDQHLHYYCGRRASGQNQYARDNCQRALPKRRWRIVHQHLSGGTEWVDRAVAPAAQPAEQRPDHPDLALIATCAVEAHVTCALIVLQFDTFTAPKYKKGGHWGRLSSRPASKCETDQESSFASTTATATATARIPTAKPAATRAGETVIAPCDEMNGSAFTSCAATGAVATKAIAATAAKVKSFSFFSPLHASGYALGIHLQMD